MSNLIDFLREEYPKVKTSDDYVQDAQVKKRRDALANLFQPIVEHIEDLQDALTMVPTANLQIIDIVDQQNSLSYQFTLTDLRQTQAIKNEITVDLDAQSPKIKWRSSSPLNMKDMSTVQEFENARECIAQIDKQAKEFAKTVNTPPQVSYG